MRVLVLPPVLVLALLLAASCSAENPSPALTTPAANPGSPSPTATVDSTCEVSPSLPPDDAVQGKTNQGELWALPPGPWEPRVNEDLRITVRVTGEGDFASHAIGPDGSEYRPAIGPVRQFGTGSGLRRPGDEWAMVFRLDKPGCWRIEVDRGAIEGVIHLEVFR